MNENKTDGAEPGTPLNAPEPAEIKPLADHLTLHADEGDDAHLPTTDDGRPDAFVVGDQTAAGALTPPGGRHPGEPSGEVDHRSANVLDPYNVNGTGGNAAVLANGDGIEQPDLRDEREATKDHPRAED